MNGLYALGGRSRQVLRKTENLFPKVCSSRSRRERTRCVVLQYVEHKPGKDCSPLEFPHSPSYQTGAAWLKLGTSPSARISSPHPDPSGGQAPALHFFIPPSTIGLQVGTFRRWRAGIEVDCRAHPGSESGTCFHSNCSCRLAPARQGMKNRCFGLVQRIRTVSSATPHPDASGGQAPALHSPLPSPSGFRPSPE